jgi:hypothetical protein
MMFSSGVAGGYELYAYGFGLLSEVVQYTLAVALFISLAQVIG